MQIFLSGPMGVGKSTVARELGRRLGVRTVDLDEQIAKRAGKSVQQIFRDEGEEAFRELERAEIVRVLGESESVSESRVVALGGGSVTNEATRRLLLARGVLVTLTGHVDELCRRVASETGRPLLAGQDARGVLEALLVERGAAYAEAHGTVDTTGRNPVEVAEAVRRVAEDAPVPVPLGLRTYRVEIGSGVRHRCAERVAQAGSGRPILITDEHVEALWARGVFDTLAQGRQVPPLSVVLKPGEAHKSVSAAEQIWDRALDAGVDRNAVAVAIGGGVVGDIAGFAAATLLRGIAVGQVPTTLLAMVDSSVGGKTGVDRPQGKNLVGSFHQPRFVLCDLDTLATLPARERTAGIAEVIKSAWLDGASSVQQLASDMEGLVQGDLDCTQRAVRMSVRLKVRVVAGDEQEQGSRRLLNLGHTVGHALEAAGGYQELRHGEAVALGLVAAFRVARARGTVQSAEVASMVELLRAAGLPTDLDHRLNERVLGFLRSDKKRDGDRIHFVLPGAPGDTQVVPLTVAEVRAALASA